MLRSFRVENYRSFTDANIELRPLTLLLGKNSSGKSSLTRFIPLLRQSFNRLTSSPVLWASDDVDFGDIKNVVHHDAPEATINISLEADPALLYSYLNVGTLGWPSSTSAKAPGRLSITARLGPEERKTVYRSTTLQCDNDKVDIVWAKSGIDRVEINGRPVYELERAEHVFADTTNLFPRIEVRGRARTPANLASPNPMNGPSVNRALDYFMSKKMRAQRREYIRESLHYVPTEAMAHYISGFEGVLKSRLDSDEHLRELSHALLSQDLSKMIGYFENVIRPIFETSSYLGPSRASGARYYRMQELSVDRIDYRGENLPMYLSSLSQLELERLNEMLMSAFGINVRITPMTGHLSIEIGQGDYYENLADVGFGYSQLLPIVAQIHASTERAGAVLEQRYGRVRRGYALMAIEQPELHLHPAMQSSLADLFAAAVKGTEKGKRGLHLLVETHSESMVGRLCSLVALGHINPEDIIIYIVEKDDRAKTSKVNTATIMKDGTIKDWPLGFFAAPL